MQLSPPCNASNSDEGHKKARPNAASEYVSFISQIGQTRRQLNRAFKLPCKKRKKRLAQSRTKLPPALRARSDKKRGHAVAHGGWTHCERAQASNIF
jgi:hypothetical protein